MKKLLSLPPDAAGCFHKLTGYDAEEWFTTSDPAGIKLGSGGGTTWALDEWIRCGGDMSQKKVLIHAGGQSRRLPAYAACGKILAPIPVFRWQAGQRLNQSLLDLQMPLYEKIMSMAPANVNTLVASGDVYVRPGKRLPEVPDADVVCYGLWVNPTVASHHGVFASRIQSPRVLDMMLQKPSVEQMAAMSQTHVFLMDVGIWLLSTRAVELLRKRSMADDGMLTYYDMYTTFGGALGVNPHVNDAEINALKVAILPLDGGEFYHFGTTAEMLGSTLQLQCKVADQRELLSRSAKPHPSLFVQNCILDRPLTAANSNIWIENSHVAAGWSLTKNNVITGVPRNNWTLSLTDGACIDVAPVGNGRYVLRPYGYNDAMRGTASDPATRYLDKPLHLWLENHGLEMPGNVDIQPMPLFPVFDSIEQMGLVAQWMVDETPDLLGEAARLYHEAEHLSADDIMMSVDLPSLWEQRRKFMDHDIELLATNHARSVIYQVDLVHLADYISQRNLMPPAPLPENAPMMKRMRNLMLSSRVNNDDTAEQQAWQIMRRGILDACTVKASPRIDVMSDQIVWGRSPVRIDLAGGWSDTPPYSLCNGGTVLNMAVELNGQAPLQTFIKPCREPHIILRSIDLGSTETVSTYEELEDYAKIGSPFSIPKAALALAGFSNEFSMDYYPTLRRRLEAMGGGLEITLLSAVGAGSGLGTSSILAATALSALSDFCALGWDTAQICRATLALEQLLTTGGGWQDQYGGVLSGIKLLQSTPGMSQDAAASWLPSQLLTDAEYAPCHILYYTGITRTAKTILADIVRGMTLNSGEHLAILADMKLLAQELASTIQRRDWKMYGELVRRSWQLNKRLDRGTNPDAVEQLTRLIDKYAAGYKLPGAGGGGYLYIVARDPQAASKIREILTDARPNSRARIVEMRLSNTGTQISRS